MMKKVLVLAAAAFAALHAAGITATKEYVDRKIGETENYADAAVRDASNNLARVIANATPADYATVSNRAMTALQAHQSLAPSTNYTDAAILAASNNLARVIANATPADYATVSNRAMTALQSHQSLAPSTNYTDAAVLAASNNLARVIANAAPADYATVSNRAMTALQAHQSLAPSTNYTDAAILAASNNIVQSIGPMAAGVTTNDVCAIVTNVVTSFSDWAVFIDGIRQWDWPAVVQYRSVDPGDNAVRAITVRGPSTVACYILESRYDSGLPPFNPNETAITNTIASGDILFSEYNYLIGSQLVLTRTANPRNALGLARLVDVPSNNSQLINGAGYTTTNDVCAVVTNTAYGEWQFDGTSWVESGITPDDQARDNIPTTLLSLNWYYSLDDVPQAAKDILEALYIDVTESILPVCYAVYTIRWSDIGWDRSGLMTNDVAGCNNTFLPFTETKVELTSGAYDYGFYITRKEYNALGLARLSDIPSTNNLATTNYADSAAADAVATADTSYLRFISATNINQSVQYINITDSEPSTLSIGLPADGRTKDWIVYVHSVTNVALALPAVTWWMADVAYTNEVPPATPTAFYFSQIADGIFYLGRQELTEVPAP